MQARGGAYPPTVRGIALLRGLTAGYNHEPSLTENLDLAQTPRIRVLIADDHPMLREGVAARIASQPDMELVGEAADGVEALSLFRLHKPDVTLIDLMMP